MKTVTQDMPASRRVDRPTASRPLYIAPAESYGEIPDVLLSHWQEIDLGAVAGALVGLRMYNPKSDPATEEVRLWAMFHNSDYHDSPHPPVIRSAMRRWQRQMCYDAAVRAGMVIAGNPSELENRFQDFAPPAVDSSDRLRRYTHYTKVYAIWEENLRLGQRRPFPGFTVRESMRLCQHRVTIYAQLAETGRKFLFTHMFGHLTPKSIQSITDTVYGDPPSLSRTILLDILFEAGYSAGQPVTE